MKDISGQFVYVIHLLEMRLSLTKFSEFTHQFRDLFAYLVMFIINKSKKIAKGRVSFHLYHVNDCFLIYVYFSCSYISYIYLSLHWKLEEVEDVENRI